MTAVFGKRLRQWLARGGPALVGIASLAIFATGASAAYLHSQAQKSKAATAAAGSSAQPAEIVTGDRLGSRRNEVAARPSAQAPAKAVAVAKLGRVYLPDAAVSLPRTLNAAQVAKLRAISGVQGVVIALRGTTTLAGRSVNVLAVDPGTFRAFTPRPTAASDALWQVPARGEAIASYELNEKGKLPLGGRLALGAVPNMRIGALAEFSLPKVDVVVSLARAAAVSATSPVVYVSAPSDDQAAIKRAFDHALGMPTTVTMLRPAFVPVPATGDSATMKADSPGDLRTLYIRAAATCPGLPWQVLAAIGQVETGNGRIQHAVSSAGAEGPMQFMPSTWAIYGVDGNGDGVADIWNQADAVYSAARYLCASGGGQSDTLYDAIYAYNHSDYYVRTVLSLAAQYR